VLAHTKLFQGQHFAVIVQSAPTPLLLGPLLLLTASVVRRVVSRCQLARRRPWRVFLVPAVRTKRQWVQLIARSVTPEATVVRRAFPAVQDHAWPASFHLPVMLLARLVQLDSSKCLLASRLAQSALRGDM
jgi:hypothetical protein